MSTSVPRISIVTPSFNQASFLEETLCSVHGQDYPDLQHVVIDGGSTDGSRDILEAWRGRIERNGGRLVIERDHGQTDAINKGLRLCDGGLVGWLCSDDVLRPGALRAVASASATGATWIAGAVRMTEQDGTPRDLQRPRGDFTLAGVLFRGADRPFELPQPGVYWRRGLHGTLGYLREDLHYCMDFEWWLRLLAAGHRPTLVDAEIAGYRLHPASKTCATPEGFLREHLVVESEYASKLPFRERLRMSRRLGYQRRAIAVRRGPDALRADVLRRPWWLLSQQVRAGLKAA